MLDAKDWLLILLGGAISAVAGYIITWRFSVAASSELRDKAEKLQRTVNVLAYGMERAGWINAARDADGNITGISFRVEPPPAELSVEGHAPAVNLGIKGKLGISGDIQIHTEKPDDAH